MLSLTMNVSRARVLRIDALINFLLGGALLLFPFTSAWLGIPVRVARY